MHATHLRLSVIKERKKKEHNMNDREYRAYDRGNSWKMALEIAIDDFTIGKCRRKKAKFRERTGTPGFLFLVETQS